MVGTSFPSAATIPLVTVTNDAAASVHALDEVQVDFEQDMTDAVNDYMYTNNEHNLMDLDIAENKLKERQVHEIRDQDPVPSVTSPSAAMRKDDSGDMLLSAKTMIGTTIFPRKESVIIPNITKDNEERERKEKEREDRLKKKNENSILNYTLVHKGGIAVTEKKKHGKKSVNA